MGSHITGELYALRTPHSKFCKDGLMMVNWPKHNWNWHVIRIRMTWFAHWIRQTVVRAVCICHLILWVLINGYFNKSGVFMTSQSSQLLKKILAWGWYGLLKRVPTNMQVQCCVRLEYILIYSQFSVYCCNMHAQKSATNIEITSCGVYCGVNIKLRCLMIFCNMLKGLKQM
jgi:hypothetical protein